MSRFIEGEQRTAVFEQVAQSSIKPGKSGSAVARTKVVFKVTSPSAAFASSGRPIGRILLR